MPNQGHPDKVFMSVRIRRTTLKRLERMASRAGVAPRTLAVSLLDEATEKIKLTAEDYAQIAKDTQQAAHRADHIKAPPRPRPSSG